jgi:hypothetical protein
MVHRAGVYALGTLLFSLVAFGQPAPPTLPPAISKFFAQSGIPVNQVTRLNFVLNNPNLALTLTGIGFTDTLPAGLAVATPNGLLGNCGGGTITATAGSGVVSLSGATLLPNASCIFSVNVLAMATGNFLNTTSAVSSTEGGAGNAARTTILVVPPPSPIIVPPAITKIFGQSPILVGQTTPLTFTITTGAGGSANTSFSDTLPAGLVVATPNGLSGGCGGGTITAVAGTNMISLSGGSIGVNASCIFSVNVLASTAGNFLNTTSNVVNAIPGGPFTGNTASDLLIVVPIRPPTINKTFGEVTVPINGITGLSFTITNPNPTVTLTGIGFTDTLPAGLVVATPNGLTGSCGAGSIIAIAGSGAISLTGATLAASASCSFSLEINALTEGVKNNSTTPVTSNEGGNGNAATATIRVASPPALTKVFTDSELQIFGPSNSTTLTFTLTNPNSMTTLTGLAFTDALPSGLIVSTPNGLTGSCDAGTITATAGSNSISLSGATLAAGASCTFSVTVTGISIGVQTNITSTLTSNEAPPGAPATASTSVDFLFFYWFFAA